ncbi:PorP/SprF family type IX secretion system membrane protein [Psychroflexus sediminis]|uniref:Type IX secretion system membrane protein, PorP/SprF family n=1 Tax=Psychroflexus sediminis TaxID=470826 RepID=A0A1G7TV51_9FLAO|nr:type IX secretion system membrane protein PorP/SprF [Psychroflexus sediminis]SDG39207.1 type IX secretion system membrane protein, PorP/SprF family [Psychroflexus sediminis]
MKNKLLSIKKRYILTLGILVLFGFQQIFAQQAPQYTQYMYNMGVVNPAYAGSKENLSVGLLYREQWSGIDGAPKTFTFNAHSPVGNEWGIGISGINDQIGATDQTDVYADISYTLDLGKKGNLAFGIKAGARFQSTGFTDLYFQDEADPAFQQDIDETYLNLGAGLLYYTDKFYVGLSVPNFLSSTHVDADGRTFGSEQQHYFITAGYVFDMNEYIKFKPSTLVKSEFGSAVSFDINANFLFYDKYEIGASYRYEDAISALASVRAADWVQIGVAYDATTSSLNEPSYEAFVIFDIFFNKKTYVSPRYF